MMSDPTRVRSLAVLVVLALVAPAARGEPPDDEAARVHFDQGKALADAGKFRAAYIEFEAGYRASARPAFLFNMGEAARNDGDPTRARTAYERYLAAAPDGPLAASARARLAALGSTPAPAPPPPAPAPATAAPPALRVRVEPTPSIVARRPAVGRRDASPSRGHRRWPLWVAIGGAALAGTVIAVIASSHDRPACAAGCIDLRP